MDSIQARWRARLVGVEIDLLGGLESLEGFLGAAEPVEYAALQEQRRHVRRWRARIVGNECGQRSFVVARIGQQAGTRLTQAGPAAAGQ